MSGKPIKTLRESENKVWNYESLPIVNGAFRLVKVNELLATDATIVLTEWSDVKLNKPGETLPKYASISHVWRPSAEAKRLSVAANRPLLIDLEKGKKRHETSWHGLTQAAKAAQFLGCEYFWLDLLCMHQDNEDDKAKQMDVMGYVYEKATAVIVMPGGVCAAQGAEYDASWMTRSWTLQEGAISPQNAHILFLHDKWDLDNYDYEFYSARAQYNVRNIDEHLAVSGLQDLLSYRKESLHIERTQKSTGKKEEVAFIVRCFGEDEALIQALEGLLSGHTDAMRKSGAWRSMWLRSQSRANDMVFSVMHLLGVHIEVDYKRDRDELLLELARKTSSFPSWLDIGNNIPFDPRFGLVPALPRFISNATPSYDEDGKVLVSQFIERGTYITEYDLKILTPVDASTNGDTICSQIFPIDYEGPSHPSVSNAHGEKYDFSPDDEVAGSHIVVLGKAEFYLLAHLGMAQFQGPAVIYVGKSKNGVWERVSKRTTIPNSFLGKARSHLRIGGPPGAEILPCDCAR